MHEPLHLSVRSGSEKARIWKICDTLLDERGALPSGREVVDRYVKTGGNEGTGFTQYSRWKKALQELRAQTMQARPSVADDGSAPLDIGPCPVMVDRDGTMRIPQGMLAAMMLPEGGRAIAEVRNSELVVVSPLAAIRRAQSELAPLQREGESVVDEFLAERRTLWGEE